MRKILKNRYLTALCAVVSLMSALPLSAAPIKVHGSVTDEKGEPLAGAMIVAKPRPDGQVRSTVTADEKGNFVI